MKGSGNLNDFEYLRAYYCIQPPKVKYFQDYITDKLKAASLSDRYDDFLAYWRGSISELARNRPESVKSAYRYDCAVVITRFMNESFRFRSGDVLHCGVGGSELIFRNDEFAARIYNALTGKNQTEITMSDNNVVFWNDALQSGKLLVPADVVKDILEWR